MFGLLAGGRPVQTDLVQVEPAKFVFVLQGAAKIHHMAVFLLPGAQMPQETAASVYAQLPGKEFELLGALTAEKQSAIFRFNTDAVSTNASDVDAMMDEGDAAPATEFNITVGISLEPAAQVLQQLAARAQAQIAKPKAILAPASAIAGPPAPTAPNDIAALANKIVTHAYNYLSSFVDAQGKVPIKAFDEWWNKFKTRLAADPAFLTNVE